MNYEGKEMTLTGDRVMVKPDEPLKVSAGGILLPPSAQKKEEVTTGLVIATGPGMLMKNGNRWPIPVLPGERVIYGKRAGTPLEWNGENYLMMHDDDMVAVLDP